MFLPVQNNFPIEGREKLGFITFKEKKSQHFSNDAFQS